MMFLKLFKTFLFTIIAIIIFITKSYSEKISEIQIIGNERISKETIIMFSNVKEGQDINANDLNIILKNIYDSNFFKDVKIKFSNNILSINLIEHPLIESISYEGIKANKIKEKVFTDLILKQRSSYNENF